MNYELNVHDLTVKYDVGIDIYNLMLSFHSVTILPMTSASYNTAISIRLYFRRMIAWLGFSQQ